MRLQLVAAWMLIACKHSTPPNIPIDPSLDDGPVAPVHAPNTHFGDAHMSSHYSLMTAARDAVIRGDVAGMREPMTWIATHEPHEKIGRNAETWFKQMQGGAKVAASMRSVNGAAAAMATVASICGECHGAMQVGPEFETEAPPDDREGVLWHMARHRWAANLMWQGLIQPSDTLWHLGLAGLQEEPPLGEDDLPDHQEMGEQERAVAEWVHAIGDLGTHASDPTERAMVFGQLLTACSRCHSTMRRPATPAQ